uniref:Uncharacterized protein n=1 Tax=Cacopsylla melanoneura TaxID=428564 RepID=A0A8D9C1R4_9HEMI
MFFTLQDQNNKINRIGIYVLAFVMYNNVDIESLMNIPTYLHLRCTILQMKCIEQNGTKSNICKLLHQQQLETLLGITDDVEQYKYKYIQIPTHSHSKFRINYTQYTTHYTPPLWL